MSAPSIAGLPHVQRALLAWHRRSGMHAPWRESGDPYQVLVAAVMAQQTQMSRVMPSYERFVAAFPTVESLAAASAGDVIRVWAGMGYNQRAIRLHRAAQTIVAGGWPHDAASLARIDGIGPFTAAIIASFAFGEPAACVDTNVRRVLGRLSGDDAIDGKRLQSLADASLAVREPARWNQALMDYGARVCGVRPRCAECVVSRWCASRREQSATNGAHSPAALLRVADERATYDAKPPARKTQPKFEGSARYYRGRIVDALRALPSGESITLAKLRATLSREADPISTDELTTLVSALESHGLVEVSGKRIALPN
jgi:A/G-specific adenine glycosylase